MTDCPQCRRHLLSHASAKCNWCGAVIGDAQYQAQAQTERDAYFIHQAQRDTQSLADIDAINVNAYDPLVDPFVHAPFARSVRRGIPVRPLTYEKQPQAMRSVGQRPSVTLVAADTGCENAALLPVPDPVPAETEPTGRFQHLEL